jgi:hypothetical protein
MKLVRIKELPNYGITFTGRHLNTMSDAELFPSPVRISANRIAYLENEIEIFIKTRPKHGEPLPVLWDVKSAVRGRGQMTFTDKPVGRRPGGRVIDGRYVMPAEAADGAAA